MTSGTAIKARRGRAPIVVCRPSAMFPAGGNRRGEVADHRGTERERRGRKVQQIRPSILLATSSAIITVGLCGWRNEPRRPLAASQARPHSSSGPTAQERGHGRARSRSPHERANVQRLPSKYGREQRIKPWLKDASAPHCRPDPMHQHHRLGSPHRLIIGPSGIRVAPIPGSPPSAGFDRLHHRPPSCPGLQPGVAPWIPFSGGVYLVLLPQPWQE